MKTSGIKVLTQTVLIAVLLLSTACSSGGDTNPTSQEQLPYESSISSDDEDVVITIGNFTDLTGPGSNAMKYATMALQDMVDYYNEHNLIPGVRLEVINYNGQLDPVNDIPGYERLKQRGANLIFSPVPSAAITLKNRLAKDKMVMFSLTPTEDALVPPGYIFSPGNILCEDQMYTLLEWIAENDPEFPTDRPAKLGGAFWAETYGDATLTGAREYAEAHPEEYDWVKGYLTDFKFTWQVEVNALKDCDYVLLPVPMTTFVEQYRSAGYEGKFIGTEAHLGFMGMIDAADQWDELDGMLFIKPNAWWNDEGEIMQLTKELLYDNHPADADQIMRSGCGYQAVYAVYVILELVTDTVEDVGPVKFSSQALYDTALSFSIEVEGTTYSFDENKRTATDYMNVYELRAEEKDIFKVNEDWIPVIYEP